MLVSCFIMIVIKELEKFFIGTFNNNLDKFNVNFVLIFFLMKQI